MKRIQTEQPTDQVPLGGLGSLRLHRALAFIVPLTIASPEVGLVGTVRLNDIVVVALVPLALKHRRALSLNRTYRLLAGLGFVWLCGQWIADFGNGIGLSDWLRGSANIFVGVSTILVLGLIVGRHGESARAMMLGFALGLGLQIAFFPTVLQAADPWKFGGLTALAIAILTPLWGGRFGTQTAVVVMTLLLSGFSLAVGTRSQSGLLLMTAIVTIWADRTAGIGTRRAVLALAASCIVATVGILTVYSVLAESQQLGEQAYRKYSLQQSGSLGVSVGGRLEVVGAAVAAAKSPVIGWGSWSDHEDTIAAIAESVGRLGYDDRLVQWDRVPAHSHLFGAWAQVGVLGVPFWIATASVFTIGIINVRLLSRRERPLVAYVALLALWDIAFSPYGGTARMGLAVAIVLCTCHSSQVRTNPGYGK